MQDFIQLLIDNKDIGMTLVLLWVIIPMFRNMLKAQTEQNKALIAETKNWFKNITDALVIHMTEDKENFDKIVDKVWEVTKSIGKTSLSDEQIVVVAKTSVWYWSEKKLKYIKKVLEKNWLTERRTTIEKQLRTELDRLSMQYIEELNGYTSSVGLVWNWVWDNFPMDEFMKELYLVIFAPKKDNKTKDECISIKVEDCSFIMKDYQNFLFNSLKKQLK